MHFYKWNENLFSNDQSGLLTSLHMRFSLYFDKFWKFSYTSTITAVIAADGSTGVCTLAQKKENTIFFHIILCSDEP